MSAKRVKEKKVKSIDDITINKSKVQPGENTMIRLPVGRLPSNTKIYIKAHVFRSEYPGPTVLILGGVHGDEINGVETIRRLIYEDKLTKLKCGTVIAIPIVNIYGFINFSRAVPDGKDVNRSFPGSLNGSLASRVARVITLKILPQVDYIIDLHTGGSSRFNFPQIRYTSSDPRALELAKIFGAPFVIKKPLISKSLRKIAKDKNIPVVVFEGGESLRFDGPSIQIASHGIQRVLNHLEMSETTVPAPERQIHFVKTMWIRASHSGLFMWSKQSGNRILKGEIIGVINDPQGLSSASVIASRDGYIIGHNNASVVNQGDALFHISYDYEIL